MPTFRSDDGTDIYYRSWGEETGEAPVVLHHGFVADSRLDWEYSGVIAALVATGRRVVASDARGHGRSGKPHDPARYGEARMARDLSLLFDVLDVPEVDLVGYSMGAVVSLITATRDPRVRRLAVGGIGASAVERGGVNTSALGLAALKDALLTDDPSSIAHPAAAAFRRLADEIGADRRALAAQSEAVHQTPIALSTLSIPTLVVAGREDDFADRPEVLAQAIPSARLHVVDGDHGDVLGNPEFAAALTSFLHEPTHQAA